MKKLMFFFLVMGLLTLSPAALAAETNEPTGDVTETIIDDQGAVEDTPDAIEYTFGPSEGDDIVVNTLTGYKLSNGAVLTLDYESTDTRDASFFNPPDGDSIKKVFRNAIKPGHNKLEILLNEKNLAKALENDSITMLLGFGDKSSFLNFKIEEIEELPVREGTLPESNGSIDFGLEASKKDKLVIHSLDGYRVSNGIVLNLRVTSPDSRSITLFNPPDGDKVMKTYNNKIVKGENSVTIEIPERDVAKLVEDGTLTMKLGLGANYTFVFFDTDVFDDLPVKEGSITASDELNYSANALKGDTLSVLSFKAFRTGKGIQFELVYESPNVRSFSLFNPPNGNKIMKKYNNQIKKGKNKIILKLNEKDANKIMESKELTFRLGFENRCTFIYLRTTELTDIQVK